MANKTASMIKPWSLLSATELSATELSATKQVVELDAVRIRVCNLRAQLYARPAQPIRAVANLSSILRQDFHCLNFVLETVGVETVQASFRRFRLRIH
jgi:hypothetical protein